MGTTTSTVEVQVYEKSDKGIVAKKDDKGKLVTKEYNLPKEQKELDAMKTLAKEFEKQTGKVEEGTTVSQQAEEGQTEGEGEEANPEEENKDNKGGDNTVLIVILSIVGLAAIAGAVWFFFCRSSEDEELDAECAVEEL